MENGVQMIKILWSIHNSAWLLIWMDMLFDRRKYIDSDKKFILTIFFSKILDFGKSLCYHIIVILNWDVAKR